MKYNIAIDLPEEIRDKAIEMSQLVIKNGGTFVLGTQNNFPHISIAHFECDDEKNIPKIIEDIKKVTNALQMFGVKSDKYRVSNGWVDVSFCMQEELIFLYEQVSGILDKYGCKVTSDDWRYKNAPHITFSRMLDGEQFNLSVLPECDFSFEVSVISLFERGEHGVNKKSLKRFELLKG